MSAPVLLVVGAGPGVGASLARRYALDRWNVALLGRNAERVESLAAELVALGRVVTSAVVDVTDGPGLTAAVAAVGESFGRIDVLHFNPSTFRERDLMELTVSELLEDVWLGVGALLTAVQAARPFLRAGARVTATGSMAADRPWHRAATLGVQKAGLRNLVCSLDAYLAPIGVRAVSVTVRGSLGPDGPFSPDRVAEAIYSAARQDENVWLSEIEYLG